MIMIMMIMIMMIMIMMIMTHLAESTMLRGVLLLERKTSRARVDWTANR